MVRALHRTGLLVWLVVTVACQGSPSTEIPGGTLTATLATETETGRSLITVTGLSSAELAALGDTPRSPDAWQRLIRLSVATSPDIAMAADYRLGSDRLEVVPQFGLDPGREYLVQIAPSELPVPRSTSDIVVRLTVPASTATPTTRVTAIFPSAAVWPANLLRFYLHFSQPMSGTSAIGHVQLVDAQGQEVADALLEIDVDLWSSDYTRRTVFFDPGRVKRGIKPNVDMGRALVPGQQYAIVITRQWRDAHGQPLAEAFRHEFTAGPPIEVAVDPRAWSIASPGAGTVAPLLVRFPWALDEGLLHRAIGVTDASGTLLDGQTTVGPGETTWTFTPASPWTAVDHSLVVLTLLEDPSGNKVGEAFEFEMFRQPTPNSAPGADRIALPFRPR